MASPYDIDMASVEADIATALEGLDFSEGNVSAKAANLPVLNMADIAANAPTVEARSPAAGKLFGAGVDMGQALLYRGGQAFSEAFGFDELATSFAEDAAYNEALASRYQPVTTMDKVIMGAGTAGPALATTAAAAFAAPVVGGSVALGGTLGGFLSSQVMTQGDLHQKVLELKPDQKADLKQLAMGGVIGIPDALLIGKARKALSPLLEGAEKSIKNAVARELIGTPIAVGASEALQDIGTSLGANVITDTAIDQSRIDAVLRAAGDEFIVGAILGVPVGGVSLGAEAMKQSQAQYDIENVPQYTVKQDEETGDFTIEQMVPVHEAAKQPSFFSLALSPIFGNVTDSIRLKHWSNESVGKFSSFFNQREGDRMRWGRNTIHAEAKFAQKEFKKATQDFYNLDKAAQQEVFDLITTRDVEGIEANPAAKALVTQLHKTNLELYERAGGEVTEMMRRIDYLPLYGAVDWKKMAADPVKAVKAVEQQAIAQGLEAGKIKKLVNELKGAIDNYNTEGTPHSYSDSELSKSVRSKLIDHIIDRKPLSRSELKGVVSNTITQFKSDRVRKSPLEVERVLAELDQSFWEKNYIKKEMTPEVRINQHQKLLAERLSHMEAFGANNEGFFDLVAAAIAEGDATGKPLTPVDVDKMFDILSTSQRIMLKPINPKLRAIQDRVRAFENMTLLGLSVIPSVAETILIPFKYGSKNTLTALGKTIKLAAATLARKAGADIPRGELEEVANDLGLSFLAATSTVAQRIGSDSDVLSRGEQTVINLSGLPLFTLFSQTWAGFAAEAHIKGMATKLNKGELSKRDQARIVGMLNEAGIDVAEVMDWESKGSPRSGRFYDDLTVKTRELVNDTIIDPDPVDKSLWFNYEGFKLITQLKSFAVAFTNRVMVDQFTKVTRGGNVDKIQNSAKLGGFISMYLVAQVYLAALREIAKTGDVEDWEDKDVYEHLIGAVSYLGAVGFFTDPFRASTYGSDPLISGLGPAVGDASKAITIASKMLDDPEGGVEDLIKRLVPNMPLSTKIKEGIIEGAGL